MKAEVLLGIVIIGVGLRFAFKGYALKSKPRILNGIAIIPMGVAQFIREQHPFLAASLMGFGLVLFAGSLYMLKLDAGRIVRPSQPRQRNRRPRR